MSSTTEPVGPDGPGGLGAVLAGLADGLLVLGPDLRCTWANPAAARLLGVSGPLPGARLADVTAAADAAVLEGAVRRAGAGGGRPEVVRRQDGRTGRWLRLRVLPSPAGTAVLVQDVTEDVVAEGAAGAAGVAADLDRARRLDVLEQLVGNTDAVITVKDLQGRYVFANTAAALTSGLGSPAQMIGRSADELYGPEVGAASQQRDLAVQAAGRPVHLQETYDSSPGEPATYLSVRFPVYDAVGAVSGTGAVLTNISGWRLTRRDLALAEQRLRDVFARTTLGFVVVDLDADIITEANEAAATMLGHPVEALVGQAGRVRVVDQEAWLARHRQAGQDGLQGYELEAELYRADGSTVPVLVTVSALDDEGTLVSLILRDLSPLRRLQQRLVDAERLEAVGSVAGGIAHDVGNVLAAVGGYADLLEPAVAGMPDPARHVAGIQRAVARASDFVDRLLAFARRQELEPVDVDLAGTADELGDMCRRLLPEGVRLVVRAPEPVPIRADPSQVQQVLLNLVLNARDAVGSRGTVRLLVDRVDAADVPTAGAEAPARVWARARGVDDGSGMDAAVLRRCFEPFFTTRRGRGGHGLGLSTAFGIARQSGGDLRVVSEPGGGTTFTLLLPLVGAPPPAPVPARPPAPRPAPARGRTDPVDPVEPVEPLDPAPGGPVVLLVDDDAEVLRALGEVLRGAGYRVVTASGGEEALRRAAVLGSRLRLLVSDVDMPAGDGPTLVRTLHARTPGLPVVLVSGAPPTTPLPGTRHLAKPVRAESLLQHVRAALDGT